MVQKNKKWRLFTKGASDYVIWVVTMLLLAMGIIMLLSASSPASLSEEGNSYKYVTKQAISAGIGIVGMIVISKVDYKIYKKLKWLIYIVVNLLLVYTGLFGSEGGGAKRWIVLFGFNFQPSELAKPAVVLAFASLFSGSINIFEDRKIPFYILFGAMLFLILKQPNLSMVILLTMTSVVMYFVPFRT